jgi:tripartite-type tricarboxylate transporter receptor subunit TctC
VETGIQAKEATMVPSRRVVLLIAALLLSPFVLAEQSAYPTKPIRMIVPFAPGGASDFVARIIAVPLGRILGEQVVIENKPGASGNIGMEYAAKAAPDGYTLFLGNIGTIAINPAVFRDLSVNPARDLVAISLASEVPSILVAHPGTGVATVKELVALAKSKPGALNFASPGPSTLNRLEMERFMKQTGTAMMHVPYKGGAGPAVTGLLGGDTHVMFVTLSSAMTFVQAGRLKALAITSPERVASLPQVPTMVESGYPDMVSTSWQGLYAPAGTPRAIVEKLHAAMLKVLGAPDIAQRFAVGGALVATSRSPEEFQAYSAAEAERWGKVVKETGATID